MFRELLDKLMGKKPPEQIDTSADGVNGAAVLPSSEPTDFEADQEGPVTPGTPQ